MKKTGFIMLPFLCAASIAMADSMGKEGPAEPMEIAAAPARASAHYRMARSGMKRLPSGDIRHCLDMKTSAEIIRCSETRRSK